LKSGCLRAGSGKPGLGGAQVEGHHAVHELLAAGRRRVRRVWVAQGHEFGPPVADIARLARERDIPVYSRTLAALARVALTEAPQGVIAWADEVAPSELGDLVAPVGATLAPFLLVLDGVTDPGNFGSVLRSAACAGVTGVVIGRHRSSPLTPAAVKAAAGALEHVPIAVVAGVPAALLEASRAGLWVVGLEPAALESLWEVNVLDAPLALVLGSEGRGLSRLARERCDLLVRIPQSGALESLNVAAAAAVACFEVARCRATGPPLREPPAPEPRQAGSPRHGGSSGDVATR